MNAMDCLNMLRDIKDVAFATVDANGKPQVRIIDVMLVEKEKLYFCTARGKAFYQQLEQNCEVAITAMNKMFQMIRLTGKVVKLSEQRFWIDRIFEQNPVMNDVYPDKSRYILEPFCIAEAELEFFDLGRTPIERACFALGTEQPAEKGFYITENCMACGTCAKVCPQQCISEGTPYVIHQRNCLHCGLCQEACPVKVIVRRGEMQ